MEEKRVAMRRDIDTALEADDQEKHDDEIFAHEEKKNDDDMDMMSRGVVVTDIEV